VVTLFCVGLMIGAMVSATVLWLLSGLAAPLPNPIAYGVVLVFGLVAVLRDAKVLRFRLPENRRLIPQEVLQRGIRSGSLQFGFEMGTGVRTYVSATAPYLVALALLLTEPGWLTALAAGAGFGAGRAATFLLRLASGLSIADWDDRLSRRLPWLIPAITGAVLVASTLSLW
jgi:hypothetical protein